MKPLDRQITAGLLSKQGEVLSSPRSAEILQQQADTRSKLQKIADGLVMGAAIGFIGGMLLICAANAGWMSIKDWLDQLLSSSGTEKI